jgi:DNA-binding GntR family transcriptional regulator
MLHYSCDLCKRPIDTATDIRHVVKIEVFQAVEEGAANGCCGDQTEDAADHLEDMQDLLESIDERDLHGAGDFNDATQSLRFDLCDACRQRFLKNPLGIKTGKKLDFSQN